MKAQRIVISGKVQGVYFRASAKQKAMNLGLHGKVKNEQDGTVVLEVEGDESAVDSMIDWCKKGPALARVSNIHVERLATQNLVDFNIVK